VPIVLYAPRPGMAPAASYAPRSGPIAPPPPSYSPPPSSRPLPLPPVPRVLEERARQLGQRLAPASLLTTLAPGASFLTTAWAVGNAAMPYLTRANMGRVQLEAGSRLAGNLARILGR
jgi:hypothetical protein